MATPDYPMKRVGAGALILDPTSDRLLLVETTYKAVWEIPGGLVEAGESPRDAAGRECAEELGLEISIGRLLVAQYNALHDLPTDDIMFVFDGGTLDAVPTTGLGRDEISAAHFVPISEIASVVSPSLAQRVVAGVKALHAGTVSYVEWRP